MALFTIADLHLSFGSDKPMDIFGAAWQDHPAVLQKNWQQLVGKSDTVVLIGDHSWGLKPEEAVPDLRFIDALPGRKILLKGNHDLWWPTAKKLSELCNRENLKTLSFLLASAVPVPDAFGTGTSAVLCGTRGWLCPEDREFGSGDLTVYKREVSRLQAALTLAEKQAAMLSEREGKKPEILAFLHYPPFGSSGTETEFTALLERFGVKRCYYGHLHGVRDGNKRISVIGDCRYTLVAGDSVSFEPQRILPLF